MTAAPDHPLLLDRASRHWALLAAVACVLPLLLQLPASLAWPIAAAGAATTLLAWRNPMPGALRLLLTLLVVGAVLGISGARFGRDTGCALLAALLAIKPSETSRLRDARSLIGFALFAPFATFLLDQGPLSLALGLAAAVGALAALQRLADLESGDARFNIPLRSRLRSVLHLVLIGLPMVLAAFWLFPRLPSPMWGVPERAMARPGLSDTMRPNDWLDMMVDDTPALRVRFFGAVPPPEQRYWRGPALWHFDGEVWTQPSWMRGLPTPETQPTPRRWDYELEMEPTDREQLVALDLPLSAPPGSKLTGDYSLRAERPLTSLTRWRLQSAAPVRHEPKLSLVLRQMALDLPRGFNPRSLALARQWRREAGSDDAAVVRRALQWIKDEFAYTLDTPPWGRNAVDEFLFDTKAGFCQHFSSSFVVLMRGAGIPARVVTGYAGGYRNPIGDYWVVLRSDAHAWAEVWLEDRGWIRVDPTAAIAPERIYDTLADRAPGAEGLFGGLGEPTWNVRDWLRRNWNDLLLGFDANRQAQLLKPWGIDRLGGQQLAMLFSLASILALLWMVWLSARGQRESDPVLRAWRQLSARYRRFGLAREPYETATDWADRIVRARPDLALGLRELSHRFAIWRYAPHQPGNRTDPEAKVLIRALRNHRPKHSNTAPRMDGRGPTTDSSNGERK
jgi:transglutaminase-like putative cysteine protease